MPGGRCAVCPHFLDATPAGDGCSVTVRCLFLESDPVEVVMTRASDLERVDAADTVGTTLHRLIRDRIHQLLVVDDDTVVGLVDAGALWGRPRGHRLRAAVDAPLPVMPRTLSLGAAARALVERGRRCALVVDRERVVGLVTRADLARAGVPGV
jgi:CBS domain-containing protein